MSVLHVLSDSGMKKARMGVIKYTYSGMCLKHDRTLCSCLSRLIAMKLRTTTALDKSFSTKMLSHKNLFQTHKMAAYWRCHL